MFEPPCIPKPTPAIYNYYVKFELRAENVPADVSMTNLYIESDIQTAATSLPALSVGVNNVFYDDESKQGRRVKITQGWTESSETIAPLPPAKPITPGDSDIVDLSSLTKLVWQAAKDTDGSIADYHIQVSSRPDMLLPVSGNFDRIINSNQPQWELPQGWLLKGQTYYWRVRARDNWGCWSNWSKIWKFKTSK